METQVALDMLSRELAAHGLAARGWTGGLDAALRRLGLCTYGRKRITLSRHLTTLNGEAEVRDTILHEIAHALAWEEHGVNCGHDARWQRIAARIGARPERTADPRTTSEVAAAWHLVHAETGEVFRSYHRRPSRDLSQSWIRGRREETFGKLAIVSAQELRRETPTADPAREAFARNAPLLGLRAEDYERSFSFKGRRFTLVEIRPRNRRFPLLGRDEAGQLYKFTLPALHWDEPR